MKDRLTPIVLALAGLALLLALDSPRPLQDSPQPSEEVPNFSFAMNGQERELADLRGQVVLLNFWATWCPPCVAEMPSLERLHQRLGGRGLLVLGVSVDQDVETYNSFLRTHNITFPNHRDPSRQIPASYGTFMYPETYIIDHQGRLVRKIVGPLEWDDPQVVDFLNRLLDDAPGASS